MEIFQTDSQLQEQAQKLEAQQSLRKQRGLLAKEFLQSEFLKQFLLPDMDRERMAAYPKPNKEGWEEEYRFAFTQDEVYSALMRKIQSWAAEAEDIEAKEQETTKSIV